MLHTPRFLQCNTTFTQFIIIVVLQEAWCKVIVAVLPRERMGQNRTMNGNKLANVRVLNLDNGMIIEFSALMIIYFTGDSIMSVALASI